MQTNPTPDAVERVAPCPTCGQYSHSLGEDATTAAFNHFQSMFSHRGDGIPTQYCYDEQARDAAQVLMSALRQGQERIERLEAENARLRQDVIAFAGPWAANYAREHDLPKGHLHPDHYDILANAGARMDSWTRAALGRGE